MSDRRKSNPAQLNRDLGSRLRLLRLEAGMTGAQLADRMEVSQSKVSRIETARVVPSLTDVTQIAKILGASSKEFEDLLSDARDVNSAYQDWRSISTRHGASPQSRVAEFERASRLVQTFVASVIPGLLQTADYARAVIGQSEVAGEETPTSSLVAERIERQSVLYQAERKFEFVVHESALYMRYGSDDTMLAQVDRLLNLASLANVTFAIVPYDIQLQAVITNGFTIYDGRFVEIELATGHVDIQDAGQVETYSRQFEELKSAASIGDEAEAILQRTAGRFQDHARRVA